MKSLATFLKTEKKAVLTREKNIKNMLNKKTVLTKEKVKTIYLGKKGF